MRTDILCRHMKQHWEEITNEMGPEACKKNIDTLSTILYKLESSKAPTKGMVWAFCGVCGKGESRGDREKVKLFVHDHEPVCTGKFDMIKYMFDHSIPKPKQTRSPKTPSEKSDDTETKVVKVRNTSFTLDALRKRFPHLLTNEERNKEYLRAKEDDPDGEHDIEDYGEDNLAAYDTFDSALTRVFEHYDHLKKTGEREVTRYNTLKKHSDEYKTIAKENRDKALQLKKNNEALQEQLIAMRKKMEALEKSIAARDQIFSEYGFNESQIESEVATRIADHLNSFRK